jgi:predicted GTPase
MPVSIKSAEFQLHESIVQLQEMLSILDFDSSLSEKLEDSKNIITTRKYNVAVMGEFKRGKSTLLNSLLGAPILPADATPTTAAVSRITYGPKEKAVLFYKDGAKEEIPFGNLKDSITKLTESGQTVSALLKEAVLFYPSVICQNYIDLIDTPGLNDEEKMTQITIDMLPATDAVIVPIHARFPFSMTEKQFVCLLLESESIHDIIFVVTFMDQLDEDDYVYSDYMRAISERIRAEIFSELSKKEAEQKVLNKAHKILDNLRICGLSASLALKAFASGSKSALEESRFPQFQKMLLASLTSGQSENAIRSAVKSIESVISLLEPQNKKKIQEFKEREINIKKRRENADGFLRDILPSTEKLFKEMQTEFDDAANRIFYLKNILIKDFISALTKVSENTHMAIFSATKPAIDEMPQKAGRFLDDKILNDIKKYFLICIDSLSEMFQTADMDFDGTDLRLSLLDYMENILKNVVFRFTMPFYPDTRDLSAADVTGHMTECIDSSTTELYWLLKHSVIEIQEGWYPLIFKHSKSVCEKLKNVCDKEAAELDMHKKAHAKNYPLLMENTGSIQLRIEELIKNITEGD